MINASFFLSLAIQYSKLYRHVKMSQSELAERMGRTPSKINDLISGKEPITVATALQLEKV